METRWSISGVGPYSEGAEGSEAHTGPQLRSSAVSNPSRDIGRSTTTTVDVSTEDTNSTLVPQGNRTRVSRSRSDRASTWSCPDSSRVKIPLTPGPCRCHSWLVRFGGLEFVSMVVYHIVYDLDVETDVFEVP